MQCLTVSKIAGTPRTQNQSARTYLIAHGPESRAATTSRIITGASTGIGLATRATVPNWPRPPARL
jgi:hypothetical protein